MPQRAVVAAGAVVVRASGREVLVVHRPRYDDWAWPKGKQEPGEHVAVTAVREVHEETGLRVRLGRPLPGQLYRLRDGRAKTVHYWVARVRGSGEIGGFVGDHEVDAVRWADLDTARELLTYDDDRSVLDQTATLRRTAALVVVRHAKAMDRSGWTEPDPLRPLSRAGERQAAAIAPLLAAYGVKRLATSPSRRCVQTLAPLGRAVDRRPALSEEGQDPAAIGALVRELLADRRSTALCTHRPVLPTVLTALGIEEEPLGPGEIVVAHHRGGRVVATERHLAPGSV